MKKFLAYLQALMLVVSLALTPAPALGQSFPKPPDVAPFTQVTPTFNTTATANTVIDSTVTPMPIGTGLTNIPVPSLTGRESADGPYDGTVAPFCKTIPFGGTCQENKFRTIVDFAFMAPTDPVRAYGQPGNSHPHCFFGNGSVNAYSTYASIRHHALNSTSAGTDVNGTGYWFPCIVSVNPYGDGKTLAIKPMSVTVYYSDTGDGTGEDAKAFIPIGLRYVSGFDMDAVWSGSPQQYAWLQSILDATNTTIGHTRYMLRQPGATALNDHYGFGIKYACVGATPTSSQYIVNPDGSDPFNGTCGATTGGVGSTGDFYIVFSAAKCYDGTNLWAPGGMKNVVPAIWDNDFSQMVCPSNYYKIPGLAIEIHYNQGGWSDRQHWDLTSDIAYRAKYSLTAAQLPPGTTFHEDWFYGWDNNEMRKWEINGPAVEHNIGHEMDSSQIDDHTNLVGGSGSVCGAGGRCPQVDSSNAGTDRSTETSPGWMLIPPAWSGSTMNMHIHH